MQCPNCKLENPPSAVKCDCGYYFENNRREDPVPIEEPRSIKEFDERLEDLRGAINGSLEDRIAVISARIRRLGWVFSAFVFFAILLIRWNGQATEQPGIVFIAILSSSIVVCLVELIILAARKFIK